MRQYRYWIAVAWLVVFTTIAACQAARADEVPDKWFDLIVDSPVFDLQRSLIGGVIKPEGILPQLAEFNAARTDITAAAATAELAYTTAIAASSRVDQVYHDVVDVTSNGTWSIGFTYSKLKGVGGENITGRTVGFNVRDEGASRICEVKIWYDKVPTTKPEITATQSPSLGQQFSEVQVDFSYPTTTGSPTDYGEEGGAVYTVTFTVPVTESQCFFKVSSSGVVISGNSLPVVGGLTGGVNADIPAYDEVNGVWVTLHIRGGIVVDTENTLGLNSVESGGIDITPARVAKEQQ